MYGGDTWGYFVNKGGWKAKTNSHSTNQPLKASPLSTQPCLPTTCNRWVTVGTTDLTPLSASTTPHPAHTSSSQLLVFMHKLLPLPCQRSLGCCPHLVRLLHGCVIHVARVGRVEDHELRAVAGKHIIQLHARGDQRGVALTHLRAAGTSHGGR